MNAARPYAEELTRALGALGKNATVVHPMLTGVENPRRAGILLITSDRGLAGGYSANAIKAANDLAERLRGEGKEPVRYVIGRKGLAYYRFRRVELAGSWTGFSEQPNFADARARPRRSFPRCWQPARTSPTDWPGSMSSTWSTPTSRRW